MLGAHWPLIWLLLPVPWLWQWLLRLRQKRRSVAASNDGRPTIPPALTDALAQQADNAGTNRQPVNWLAWICWLLLLAALSQPYLVLGSQVQPASGRALMLAIDLSGSMEKRDFELDGHKSDRLSAVKRVAIEFAKTRRGDRLGLVLFADEAFAASPLTFDTGAVASAIAEAGIGMVGRTTAIGDAIGLATIKLRDDPADEKAIILLSDGTNNAGSTEPEDAAALATQFGIRIHTIALSGQADPDGGILDPAADLDEATLKAVATAAGGRHFRATSLTELSDVYQAIGSLESEAAGTPPLALRRSLTGIVLLALWAVLLVAPLRNWLASRWLPTPGSRADIAPRVTS